MQQESWLLIGNCAAHSLLQWLPSAWLPHRALQAALHLCVWCSMYSRTLVSRYPGLHLCAPSNPMPHQTHLPMPQMLMPARLQVGYCQGMAFVAGIILMYLPEEPAYR